MKMDQLVKFDNHILAPCGIAEYWYDIDFYDVNVDIVDVYVDVETFEKVAIVDGVLVHCPDKGRKNAFLSHYASLKELERRPKRGRRSNSKNKWKARIERAKAYYEEEELPF